MHRQQNVNVEDMPQGQHNISRYYIFVVFILHMQKKKRKKVELITVEVSFAL